jgi:hypothetical protein
VYRENGFAFTLTIVRRERHSTHLL